MITAGIDLGGTKIETRIFNDQWHCVESQQTATPDSYSALVDAIAAQCLWINDKTGTQDIPLGLGMAGLTQLNTGLALTANLPADGKPFITDLLTATGRKITVLNDCRAATLSEAVFGVGRQYTVMVSLIFGTGVGGGVAVHGKLLSALDSFGGEFGHIALPAHLVVQHSLPIVRCGCGRMGCYETLVSGKGIAQLAEHRLGKSMSSREIAALKSTSDEVADIWNIWVELVAEFLMNLTLAFDPGCIVLGGGLSKIDGIETDLAAALAKVQWQGFAVPAIVQGEGGASSGSLGAAYAAYLEVE